MAKVVFWEKAKGRCVALIQRDPRNPASFEECGRPAKGSVDDAPVCGIHLRMVSRRDGSGAMERRNDVG